MPRSHSPAAMMASISGNVGVQSLHETGSILIPADPA